MTTRAALAAALLLASAGNADGQLFQPRAADYLFTTNASDVRATWINPAGLSIVPEASLYGSVSFDLADDATDFHTAQYAIGFSSRGLSVAYHQERFRDGTATGVIRGSTAIPLRRGALGIGVSQYRLEGDDDRDFDVGVMFVPSPWLTVGGVARHIGRATLLTEKYPITLTGGAQLNTLGQRLQIQAELNASERLGLDDSGFDRSYRAGASLFLPLPRPLVVITAFDLGSNLRIDRFHFGFAVGPRSQIVATGTAIEQVGGNARLERIGVAGVASNILSGR